MPDDEDDEPSLESGTLDPTAATGSRESIRYQAKVAQIGAQMGFHIWVPRNDRARVLEHIPRAIHESFLDALPLNYDDTTLRTVEQIDVLWLKGRSMARAFEIEHTTAIYSGLLRMADLLALQPNMDIRPAHRGSTGQAGKGPSRDQEASVFPPGPRPSVRTVFVPSV